ncbi:PREDICTED: centrosomal protein POC5 isoform X5 [Thamnophis sirtalis]|uniref:Centrosomal protein POC5 n=1 Tax=Thamnophis sirtalis TaxID=35019 RepID=A0A6I9XKV9_9SAUR|nr:PREDICTED: centrosomal protein POC5 isoform X5 [Thamnophis sirtalis]
MSSSEEKSASPVLPKDSDRGSSVSSDLQDEYEELLRYAVVTPKFEPSGLRQSDHMEGHQIPAVSASVKEAAHMDMERLCPIRSEETTSPGSSSSQRDLHGPCVTDISLSDDRVTHIESILDLWSGSLKTNVLTELRKWKLHFIEHHTLEMRQEREKHAADVRQLTNQMENLKELLHTYEISLGRKDEVIANLTHAIEKQKDRIELMKKFTKWRLQHFLNQQRAREQLCANRLADQLYKLVLLRKVWVIWRSSFNTKCKETMEKAVQSSVEAMRAALTNEYESKLQTVTSSLEEARSEIIELQNQRQDYEDAMKKAFMRGVCALNLEAMSMFQSKDFKLDQVGSQPGPSVRSSIFRQQQEQVNSEVRSQPGLSTRSSMFRQQQEQVDSDGPSTRSSIFRQQQEQVNGEVRNQHTPGPSNKPSMFRQQQEQVNEEVRNPFLPGPSVKSSIFQQQEQGDGEVRNQLHPVPSNRPSVFRQQQEKVNGEVRNQHTPGPSNRPSMFRQQQEQVNDEARNQLQPVPSVRSSIFQQQEQGDGEVVDLPEKRAESGAGTGGPTAKFSSFQPMPSMSSLPQPPPHFAPTTAGSAPAEDLFSSHQGHAVTSQTRLDSAAAITCGAATGSGAKCIAKLPMTRVVTSAQQKPGRTVTAKITGRSDFSGKNRICSNLDVLGVSPPMNSVVVEKHHPVTQQTISQAVAAKYPRTMHQSSNAIGVRHLGHNGKTPVQSHNNIQSIKVVE